MRKRIDQKLETAPEWVQLATNEKLLFCGISSARVSNPFADNAKQAECVVLTDKRLVVLSKVGAAPAVTSMPLSRIHAIQTTALSWNAVMVLVTILGFLCWIVPGVIILIYMILNAGPKVNVIAGNLRVEIKFSPSAQPLFREFVTSLDLYSSFK